MQKDDKKDMLSKIKDFLTSKTGKATLFFGFYFFFFLFIALSFKVNNNVNDSNTVEKVEEYELFHTTHITDKDYTYSYVIYEDDDIISFTGNSSVVNEDLKNYANNYFLNIYNLKQIIKNSKYLSKIEDANKCLKYKYEIKTSELIELLENDIELLDDGVNNIEIYTNSLLYVTSIKLDLSDYMRYAGYNKYVIELNYQEGVENGKDNIN